jgi:4-aminobutyrate---pyruvate transaminase
MFGCQTYDIQPDILVLSKALSSSYLPISAFLANDKVLDPVIAESDRIGTFGHGFTGGGHPVAAAVALESVRLIEERNLVQNASASGERLRAGLNQLKDHPLVGEVRGVGLIAAVELVVDKTTKAALEPIGRLGGLVCAEMQNQGVISRNMGDAIAFCPPLIITASEVDDLLDRFRRALNRVAIDLKSSAKN